MPLETATHISGLVASNPASSDGLNQADDHLRLIKSVLLNDVGNALTSKALTVVDGSSSAPSISFAADATAGFYRKGTGQTAVVGSLIGQGPVEIGNVVMHAATTPPNGYLACDGQAVSRTTYAALFAVIGGQWGSGDGSTTFNVPNLLDRFPRQRNVSGDAGQVGTTQASQNKAHTHLVSGNTGINSVGHTHDFSGNTGTESAGHTHTTTLGVNNGVGAAGTVQYTAYAVFPGGTTASATPVTSSGNNASHTHAYSGTTGSNSANHTHAVNITSAGGSADGTDARPLSATLLFCIRAL